MATIYFEDVEEGTVRDLGSYTVPEAEMRAFSERYDPQPIHVDEEAAVETPFGGVIASGWYTASVCMRLFVDGFLAQSDSIGSPGLEELSWSAPVYAGDTLAVENEILSVEPSTTRDDRGYVRNETQAYNQNGDKVLNWIGTNILLCRNRD